MHLKAYASHLPGVQVMAIISLIAILKYIQVLILQAENCMTGRAYMGGVFIQVWLKSIKNE